MLKNNKSGIYAITPTYIFKNELLDAVEATLESEIKLIQYRFKNDISFEEKDFFFTFKGAVLSTISRTLLTKPIFSFPDNLGAIILVE